MEHIDVQDASRLLIYANYLLSDFRSIGYVLWERY